MLNNPDCAICGGQNWNALDIKSYGKSNVPEDDYGRVRHQVLFDIWFQGSEEVKLTSILCQNCGFVCYRPRPDQGDIKLKYDYIANHESASGEFTVPKASDRLRSLELFRHLSHYLGKEPINVLDYGGGNGRLLGSFLDAGHKCAILELVNQALPGIDYVGSSLSELAQWEPFNLLICSHVLEHLVEPETILRQLARHVRKSGIIYVEVPAEIWHRAPPTIDPVTHINFFSTDSLRVLLERAGIEVISCRFETFIRPNGMVGMAVKAVGRPSESTTGDPSLPGPGLTETLLSPSLLYRLKRILLHPRLLTNLVS